MPRESTLRAALPVARAATEFLIEELDGELLVYDKQRHRAHCLTPQLAALWQLCDGRRTQRDAEAALARPPAEIASMIAQLEAAALIQPRAVARPRRLVNRGRRAFVRKSAVAAGVVLASPVIFSIVAPSVAEAASPCGTKGLPCCEPGDTCLAGPKACSGPGGQCLL